MENKELLERAASEIRGLRNQNKEQRLRLQMFDDCMLLLTAHLHGRGEGAMSPDVVYEIEKALKNSVAEVKPSN